MPDVSAAERRIQTIETLKQTGHVSVSSLSERFGVSEVTIRKDLSALEDESIVVRTHGGAVLAEHFRFDLPFDAQAERHAEEKRRIGAAAAARIGDHDRIALAAGSTTAAIVRHLEEHQGLTIFTNSIRIAYETLGLMEIDVLMPGGQLSQATASTVGPYAEHMLRDHSFDRAFLTADGYDPGFGLTTTSMLDAHVMRLLVEASDEVVVVADASKFGRRGLSRVCGPEAIDVFITDDRISPATADRLDEEGIAVIAV